MLRLDAVANHPSGNGLVITGRDLAATFPELSGLENVVTVFLRPIGPPEGLKSQMVAFVFEGAAAQEVNGLRQSRLSLVASGASAFAA